MVRKVKTKDSKKSKPEKNKTTIPVEELTKDARPEEDEMSSKAEKPETGKTAGATEKESPGKEDVAARLAVLNDKYVRLLAEYDNYRKRTAREMENTVKFAAEKLMAELLPILDNLDRATEHRNNETTYEEYIKGIALIEDQLREALARAGLESIDVIGKPFDPEFHEAVIQVETDEYKPGMVSAEVEKGYMLAGKVIRYSKVVVSK